MNVLSLYPEVQKTPIHCSNHSAFALRQELLSSEDLGPAKSPYQCRASRLAATDGREALCSLPVPGGLTRGMGSLASADSVRGKD